RNDGRRARESRARPVPPLDTLCRTGTWTDPGSEPSGSRAACALDSGVSLRTLGAFAVRLRRADLSHHAQYVWLGRPKKARVVRTASLFFRLAFEAYYQGQGGTADIPTLDDFLCQETTHWSGLGVIDMLAAILDITDRQRHDLRSWYERHMAYFR